MDQIWAWLPRGHRLAVGVRDPLKSSVTGPSLLVNCYIETKFHKKIRVNPPLNPARRKKIAVPVWFRPNLPVPAQIPPEPEFLSGPSGDREEGWVGMGGDCGSSREDVNCEGGLNGDRGGGIGVYTALYTKQLQHIIYYYPYSLGRRDWWGLRRRDG